MKVRVIGIDLAVKAKHTAAILDPASRHFLAKGIRFRTHPQDMMRLLERVREEASADVKIVIVLEATAMSWFPVGQFFHRQGAEVYRVHGRATKAQRQTSWPYARSDRLDSMALALLYTSTPPQRLHRWFPPSSELMALQRMGRELQRLVRMQTGIQQRLQALHQWAWCGWEQVAPARYHAWIFQNFYDPWTVTGLGEAWLVCRFQEAYPDDDPAWIQRWLQRAQMIQDLYQDNATVGYDHLAQFIVRELERMAWVAEQRTTLVKEHFLPLYRQCFPQDPLLSFQGIGERSAAIYRSFILDITRFPNGDAFAQWTGMVPRSDQSGDGKRPHMPLSKQGPNLIKATLYQNADVARQWDVQLAQIYYRQMVDYGKHHTQAVCAVASHLARRIYAVLRDNRPYQLRNLDGHPISKEDSRALILERFQVPESLRKQRRKHRQS